MKKTYILDTNVLLSDYNALSSFDEHDIVIPLIVLEELDRHKTRQDEVGANARCVSRKLDEMRKRGSLLEGLKTLGGGIIRVAKINELILQKLSIELQGQKVDNMIIAYALEHKNDDSSEHILVSRDINVRLKCDSIGVKCEDYRKTQVVSDINDAYTGVLNQEADQILIDSIHDENVTTFVPEDWKVYPNQIVVIKQFGCPSGSTIARVVKRNDKFELRKIEEHKSCFGLSPRNKEQNFSLDLLLDPEIKLVTLSGIAGSGKSLIALSAALAQNNTLHDKGNKKLSRYSKLVIARSLQPVGKDTGFLPGTLLEKLMPWQSATTDNLQFLMTNCKFIPTPQRKVDSNGQQINPYLSILMEKGIIEIASISHIRGRSIPDSFVIVEEAQNLTPHEIRTLTTRIGEGTKLVFCGDTDQIDNIYVDKMSNGFTYLIEKFKDSTLAAHVTLKKGCRSALATEATQLLI